MHNLDETGPPERGQANAWHLDKRVPIAVIVALALNIGATIWFAAGMVRDIEQSKARIDRMEPAVRDSAEIGRRVDRLERINDAQDEILRLVRESLARIDERLAALVARLSTGPH